MKFDMYVYSDSTPLSKSQIKYIKFLAKKCESQVKHKIAKEAKLYLRRKKATGENAVDVIYKLKDALS